MGYDTRFQGHFVLDAPLTPEQVTYLKKFAETRRMTRHSTKAAKFSDPVRKAVGLPIGGEGAYFVGGAGFMGQGEDKSVVDHNRPPSNQPSLWCQWEPTEDGCGIEWNGAEKFYGYIDWLQYIIDHFLNPWGRKVVSGEVQWRGEDWNDTGTITVMDGKVIVKT